MIDSSGDVYTLEDAFDDWFVKKYDGDDGSELWELPVEIYDARGPNAEGYLSDLVLDDNGKYLYSIKNEYNNIKFTEDHKREILNFYKSNSTTKQFYDLIEKNIIF